jgi:hypothetical protein
VTKNHTEMVVIKAIESNTKLEIPIVAMMPGACVVVDSTKLDFGTCIADGRLYVSSCTCSFFPPSSGGYHSFGIFFLRPRPVVCFRVLIAS